MTINVKSEEWPYNVEEPIDPSAVLNYGIDWSDTLPIGSAIQTATWNVIGGTEEHSYVSGAQTIIVISVNPGAVQVEATVHVTLDTSPIALEDERTLILEVKDR